MTKSNKKEPKEESLVKKLWGAANKLKKNIDAAEYKHIALGLIFLKYISDAYEELREKLEKGEGEYAGADPEDKDEYKAEKIFFVPEKARWKYLQGRAKLPSIGKDIDDAMDWIEKDNESLRGVLPRGYEKSETKSNDQLDKIYEYFLEQFALKKKKKAGQFYTPTSVVRLLVELIEPYEGRVFDPCCGSGGMFVQSEKFVNAHSDHYKKSNGKKLALNPSDRIAIYGQESNQTTWRLCKMNLSIRTIDSSNVKWNNEGSFLNDLHKDLKADFILANPPFNDGDWSGNMLRDDARWDVLGKKLPPPVNNANYAWLMHIIYHLAPNGTAGVVLSKGSLTSQTSNEGEIRKAMIKANLVDCIVNLPPKLFLNTQIPACLWILSRSKANGKFRNRQNEILFIDARNMGFMIDRRNRDLSEKDIADIANIYHNWRNKDGSYEDIAGFCKSASIEEVEKLNFVLTPGRFVGLADEEDDFNFEEKFTSLKSELEEQMRQEEELNKSIIENILKLDI